MSDLYLVFACREEKLVLDSQSDVSDRTVIQVRLAIARLRDLSDIEVDDKLDIPSERPYEKL